MLKDEIEKKLILKKNLRKRLKSTYVNLQNF